MTERGLRILLVGAGSPAIQMLQLIERSGHQIVAVLAPLPGSHKGRGSSLAEVASERSHAVWPASRVTDPRFAETVSAHDVDILLNIFSLYLVDRKVLAAPRYGCFNLHPGPLPRYAGLNSVQWGIFHGEQNYGVTLHKMTSQVDCGSIVFQSSFEIKGTDTALSVTTKCIQQGLPLVTQLLDIAAKDPASIPDLPQDLSRFEYFGRQIPSELALTWTRPAQQIVRFVRACDYWPFDSPWGHPRAKWMEREINIVKADLTRRACHSMPGTIGERVGSSIEVATADEWMLIQKLLLDGHIHSAGELLQHADRLQDAT